MITPDPFIGPILLFDSISTVAKYGKVKMFLTGRIR